MQRRRNVFISIADPSIARLVAQTVEQQGLRPVREASYALRELRGVESGANRNDQGDPGGEVALIVVDVEEAALSWKRLQEQTNAPVLALAGDPTLIAEALDAGADGYLLYPCHREVLRATIQALLRRQRPEGHRPPAEVVTIGDLRIDLGAQRLQRGGADIALSALEWSLLGLLVRHAGQILTQRQILRHVWGTAYRDESTYVRTYIARLRTKLGDAAAAPRYIITVPRIGYTMPQAARPAIAGARQDNPWVTAQPAGGAAVPRSNRQPSATDGPGDGHAEPADAPAADWAAALPATPPTPLFGREADLRAVSRAMLEPATRLLTITGSGGSGKTRIAEAIGQQLGERFRDGSSLVRLAGIAEPELVLAAVVHALHLAGGHQETPLASLARGLAGCERLVILDNLEPARAVAPDLKALLLTVPGLKLLATSRSPLELALEHEYPLAPLALPAPHLAAPTAELAGNPAVGLLLARAQVVQPSLALSDANAASIAAICRRLDGLPLALELAAARMGDFTPDELLQRLDQRLALLVGGPRDLPARQQTLRATLEWSHQLLTEDERRLFARLAAFPAGASPAALDAICNAPGDLPLPIFELAESLVRYGLLRRRAGDGSAPRYAMAETVRAYALERLAQEPAAGQLREAYARHYAALAAELDTPLAPARRQAIEGQLADEYPNLRAALDWSVAYAPGTLGLALAAGLRKFWPAHGHHREGRRYLESVLAQTVDLAMPERVRALVGLGWLAVDQADFATSTQAFDAALALAETIGDQRGLALALLGLGDRAHREGANRQASDYFERSLHLFEAIGDQEEMAWSLDLLGRVAHHENDDERAAGLFERSLALFRELEHTWGTVASLYHLAELIREGGGLKQAHDLYLECRELLERAGEGRNGMMALVLNFLGEIAMFRERWDEAHAWLERSLRLIEEADYRWCLALVLGNQGRLAAVRDDPAAACAAFGRALALPEIEGWRGTPALFEHLALWFQARQPEIAARLLGQSAALRDTSAVPRQPLHQPSYERAWAAVQRTLGANAAAEWESGRRATIAATLAEARAALDQAWPAARS